MFKFYFVLWLDWLVKLTMRSVVYASIISFLVTIFFYVNYGVKNIDIEITNAMIQIFIFWFPIAWSFTLLVFLFRELKSIFNRCHNGYKLLLLNCKQELLEVIGYGDILKVWRKYLILLIWIVAVEMVIASSLNYILYDNHFLFKWFNIYILYFFILIASFFSFIILSSKCTLIKVRRC